MNYILDFWLGVELTYPKYLYLFFGCFALLRIYGDLYMAFLNGIGELKWQLYLSIFGALINIPLSIYFVKFHGLEASGVILATCCSLFLLTLLMPFQTYKILKIGQN